MGQHGRAFNMPMTASAAWGRLESLDYAEPTDAPGVYRATARGARAHLTARGARAHLTGFGAAPRTPAPG
ncbi:hypothetical protein GCM10028793_28890 [Nocardiopsis oceani]